MVLLSAPAARPAPEVVTVTSGSAVAAEDRVRALPDVVYPFKDTCGTDELRYSLRSLAANAPRMFGKVWIVGDLPDWAADVNQIQHRPVTDKVRDFRARVAAAAGHPDVASRFLLMNDDIFLASKVRKFEAFHSGPASQHYARMVARGVDPAWLSCFKHTADWMRDRGHGDVLTRQGHRPLLWDKAKLAAVLAEYPQDRPLDVVGLYDAAGDGGEGTLAPNMKVTNSAQYHAKIAALGVCPWLSSSDDSFRDGLIGGHIRALFPKPSRFERG